MDDNLSEPSAPAFAPQGHGLEAMQPAAPDRLSPIVARATRWLPISGVLALAGFLYFTHLSQNGYANQYYSAAVISMTQSWKNFFFGSFDPAGFITVDKPPAAIWVQAASARLFGVNSWSLLLPQAMAGLFTVALLWDVVRRRFGELAGIVAAVVLATTPIVAATARVNLPDAPLVLVLVASAWTGLRATEQGSLRWCIATAALIGLAFNIKMLQAYLVLPAFLFTYFVCAPVGIRTRLLHLTAAMVVLVAVSGSWAAIVDVVPADSRPYVGGSTDNSVRDLIFGYNGFERITGDNSPFPGGRPPGGPGGFFGLNFGGAPGWTRLFNAANAGQVAWLMPLALAGFLAGIAACGLAPRTDPRRASVIYWGAWAAVHFVVFSKAEGIFHPYYTAALAPGLAALLGIAVVTFVAWARGPSVWFWAAPGLAMAATAALQIYLLRREPPWNEWLEPTVIGGTAAALTAVILGGILVASGVRRASSVAAAGVLVGFVALFLSPLMWSVSVVDAQLTGVEPQAGPTAQAEGIPFDLPANHAIAVFLTEEQGEARFLMATFGASGAAPYIVETGEPVLAIGGFVGTDPVPTLNDFQELIETGKLRFVVLGGLGLLFQPEIQTFVRQSCVEVAPDRYADSQEQPPGGAPNVFAGPLYDCAP